MTEGEGSTMYRIEPDRVPEERRTHFYKIEADGTRRLFLTLGDYEYRSLKEKDVDIEEYVRRIAEHS